MLAMNSHGLPGRLPVSGLTATFLGARPASAIDELAARGIFIGLVDLGEWHPWVDEATRLLSPDERDRVARCRSPADRSALALTYALHRLLLGQALHCDAAAVPVARDEAGAPRLLGCLHATSLSHAGRRAAAFAITMTGPVGVDLEPVTRTAIMQELADWVRHPADADGIAASGEGGYGQALLELWVRKEAFLKAAGVGMSREMNTFPAPDKALLPLPDGRWSEVRLIEAGPQWVAAISGTPGVPIHCAWLHPRPAQQAGQNHQAAC